MNRKDFLKKIGMLTVGATILGPTAVADAAEQSKPKAAGPEILDFPIKSLKANVKKAVSIIIIGAGNRGRTYAHYSQLFPEAMKVVGVADTNEARVKDMAKKYNIPAENCFSDFKDVFARPKFADAVAICTPDFLHYAPTMLALQSGYDILLEKPVAQNEKECRDILAATKKYNRIVAVCHVLRYAPYFVALKQVIDSGEIGDIVSIQHFEPVQYAHMAHSFVRGNWRDSNATTPIIVAKSCHDLDILRWLIGKPCKTISMEGCLTLFKPENAPKGATKRCIGCPVEPTCPYSAIDIYVHRKNHLGVFDLKNSKDEAEIMEKVRTTPYGRCVYFCDNNQPDHLVSNMVFEGGVTASFNMEAFTPWGGRRTRIMGTKGYIEGDMTTFKVTDFRTRHQKLWNKKISDIPEYKGAGHGGGDLSLARDFIQAVSAQDPTLLSSSIDASIESHVMGFQAEESRLTGKRRNIKL